MAEPFIGEIRMFAGNFAPVGWAMCGGQILSIAENQALFALLGTTYGGDGQTTFALPNLNGRFAIHQGQGPGLSQRVIGQALGEQTVTLTTSQLPSHTHPANCSNTGTVANPKSNFWGTDQGGNIAPYSSSAPNAQMAPTLPAGGSQPHANVQPYLAITYIIALFGIFPSRQ